MWLTSSLLKNEGQYFDSMEEYISSYALNNGGVDLSWTTSDIGPSNAAKNYCDVKSMIKKSKEYSIDNLKVFRGLVYAPTNRTKADEMALTNYT